jgi:hypothetical protein
MDRPPKRGALRVTQGVSFLHFLHFLQGVIRGVDEGVDHRAGPISRRIEANRVGLFLARPQNSPFTCLKNISGGLAAPTGGRGRGEHRAGDRREMSEARACAYAPCAPA